MGQYVNLMFAHMIQDVRAAQLEAEKQAFAMVDRLSAVAGAAAGAVAGAEHGSKRLKAQLTEATNEVAGRRGTRRHGTARGGTERNGTERNGTK